MPAILPELKQQLVAKILNEYPKATPETASQYTEALLPFLDSILDGVYTKTSRILELDQHMQASLGPKAYTALKEKLDALSEEHLDLEEILTNNPDMITAQVDMILAEGAKDPVVGVDVTNNLETLREISTLGLQVIVYYNRLTEADLDQRVEELQSRLDDETLALQASFIDDLGRRLLL